MFSDLYKVFFKMLVLEPIASFDLLPAFFNWFLISHRLSFFKVIQCNIPPLAYAIADEGSA